MRKTIMILGASILQLPAIIKAKEMGLRTVVVDMNPDAIGFKEDGVIKEVISTIDKEAVFLAAKRNKIDGIMTLASDMPMRTVAYVASTLGIAGVSEDTALKATDKFYMRKALKEHNVPIPDFYEASSFEEYSERVKLFDKSFIVKPTDNSGSRGIFVVQNKSENDKVKEAYLHAKQFSRNGNVLVEEFMKGPEVSVETLTVNGECFVIQVTDKLTTGAPHFVEMGHSQPSMLGEEIVERIKQVAIAANKAIGIKQGPSHTEIIVTESGPKIVELGARLGGDCITTHLVPLSTGVDMVESCIKIALGEKPDITVKEHSGSAIRYFHQKAGVLKAIDDIDKAENLHGIKEIEFVRKVGEKISEVSDSASRIGFAIAKDDTAALAIKDCEKALQTVKITIE